MTDAPATLAAPAAPPSPPPRAVAMAIDYGERAFLVLLYAHLVENLAPSLGRAPINSLLLVGESLVVGFMILRRASADVSARPLDWLLALGGTVPSLFLKAGGEKVISDFAAAGLMIAGIGVQVSAKACLRRSFGMAPANRGIKRGGPYRLVRHPMYLGYAITWIGFVLVNLQPFDLALVGFACAMQVARVSVEERLLLRDPAYAAFTRQVRWRLVPALY